MKILIFMAGFFPGKKYGGPPVSIDNFCSLISNNDNQIFIVTTNHDLGNKEKYQDIMDGWNNRGNCKVLYLSDADYNKSNFENVIKELSPDLIYLQGLFQKCIVSCLLLSKKYRVNVLLAPRGELCSGAFKKKYKKVVYLILLRILGCLKNIHFQSTSEEETRMILKWLISNTERVFEISNIPSMPKCSRSNLNKISGEIRVVFISRIVPKKNLLYALNILSEIRSCVIFDIYGAKEDKDYWKNCEDVINKLPANIKVTYKGVVSHEEIHSIFAKYHVFFFPTFSENYGHVIAEAFSVGCYVLTSDQVPWLDMNEYGAGNCVSLDNGSAFKEDILRILELNNEEYAQVRENCIVYSKIKLNIEDLRLKYNNMFESMCLS